MTVTFSDPLDLAQLPPFQLVAVDDEVERQGLLDGVTARLHAKGVPYNVGSTEFDPVVALVEEVAYRKTVALAQLNDAGKRFTLAYGYGAALDHIAATYYADIGVRRLAGEIDDAFRERIVLANDARSPFTPGAYRYAARTASVDIVDAVALNFSSGLVARRGDVLLVILGREGADEAALCVTARDFIAARAITAETDTLLVQPARHVPVTVARTIQVLHGPDATLIQAQAAAAIETYRVAHRKIGRVFAVSGVDAAAHRDGVETVRPGLPAADVDPGPDGVVEVTAVTLTMEALGG